MVEVLVFGIEGVVDLEGAAALGECAGDLDGAVGVDDESIGVGTEAVVVPDVQGWVGDGVSIGGSGDADGFLCAAAGKAWAEEDVGIEVAARCAASITCGGVGKSGSPVASDTTLLPAFFKAAARSAIWTISEISRPAMRLARRKGDSMFILRPISVLADVYEEKLK